MDLGTWFRIGCGLGIGYSWCDGVGVNRGRDHCRQLLDLRHKGVAGNRQKGGAVRQRGVVLAGEEGQRGGGVGWRGREGGMETE